MRLRTDAFPAVWHGRRGPRLSASVLTAGVGCGYQAALNYTRMASDTAETLWLLDRRDHLRSVEAALRLKALPADFRFPMMDLRLSLARFCALDGKRVVVLFITKFTSAFDEILADEGVKIVKIPPRTTTSQLPCRAVGAHHSVRVHSPDA